MPVPPIDEPRARPMSRRAAGREVGAETAKAWTRRAPQVHPSVRPSAAANTMAENLVGRVLDAATDQDPCAGSAEEWAAAWPKPDAADRTRAEALADAAGLAPEAWMAPGAAPLDKRSRLIPMGMQMQARPVLAQAVLHVLHAPAGRAMPVRRLHPPIGPARQLAAQTSPAPSWAQPDRPKPSRPCHCRRSVTPVRERAVKCRS